jgi:hypothetical protein
MNVPAKQRAGTPLTDDPRKRVDLSFIDQRKGRTRHGTIDFAQHFYQIGGQFSDFHFRKRNLITMPFEIWEQLQAYGAYLNYIEWYDREENAAYLVSMEEAVDFGEVYSAGIGQRYGVPFGLFVKTVERL